MNSITRLILRRVVSGNVTLTPHVLKVLREFDQDHPDADKPKDSAKKPSPPPDKPNHEAPTADKRLTFENPLPGRWIRRTSCLLGGALLLTAGSLRATTGLGTFETANNAFAQGKYAEAVRNYESIIAQQGYSAPVLFNLANAQQRNGQLGQAILNYERAAMLAPNDSDLATNLRAARQKAGVPEERRALMPKAAHSLTLSAWFSVAAIALFLLAAALPFRLLWPRARLALSLSNVTAVFVLVAAVIALGIRWPDLHRAVVIAPEAVAGIAPVTVAQPMFKLRAGEVVTLKQIHGAFARIENHVGHEGWVKASDIERVIGSPAPASSSQS
jgi:hypothetical protein